MPSRQSRFRPKHCLAQTAVPVCKQRIEHRPVHGLRSRFGELRRFG
jgi:hypothetical protein